MTIVLLIIKYIVKICAFKQFSNHNNYGRIVKLENCLSSKFFFGTFHTKTSIFSNYFVKKECLNKMLE